jgi:hypothetical protein
MSHDEAYLQNQAVQTSSKGCFYLLTYFFSLLKQFIFVSNLETDLSLWLVLSSTQKYVVFTCGDVGHLSYGKRGETLGCTSWHPQTIPGGITFTHLAQLAWDKWLEISGTLVSTPASHSIAQVGIRFLSVVPAIQIINV